jgi:hypothetical protein
VDPIVVLKGALPPIAAALLFVSLGGVRLLPFAAACGLFVAFGLLKNWHDWPTWPHELWQAPNGTMWLVWGIVAACLVALLEHLRLLPGRVAGPFGAAVAGVGVWLLLERVMQAQRWPPAEIALHVGGGALIAVLLVLACRRVLERAPGGIAPAVVFSVSLSAVSVAVALSSALLGQLCGVVAAALGAAAGTALWRRPFALPAADGTWIGAAHALFVLAGVHLGSLPWSAAGAALLAPCALLLLRPGAAKRPVGWTAAALLLAGMPLAGAIWFATR